MSDQNNVYGDDMVSMAKKETAEGVSTESNPNTVNDWDEDHKEVKVKKSNNKPYFIFGAVLLAFIVLATIFVLFFTPTQKKAQRITSQSKEEVAVQVKTKQEFIEAPQPEHSKFDKERIDELYLFVERAFDRIKEIEKFIQDQVVPQVERLSVKETDQVVGSVMNDDKAEIAGQLKNFGGLLSELDTEKKALSEELNSTKADLKKLTERVESSINALTRTKKEVKEEYVTGENLHLISASDGLVFLKRIEGDQTPFSLEVGENLRGWGRVTRVTSLGCVYVGDKILKATNSKCI